MKQYYYHNGQQNVGPMSLEDLKAGPVSAETLVWYEGLSNWVKAISLPELQGKFAASTERGGMGTSQTVPTGAYQNLNSPNSEWPYTQPMYGIASSKPNLTVLKVFSVIGIILSVILFIVGAGVLNLHASGCWNCDCYPYVSGNEELAVITFMLSLFFLTFSIITAVKAFKRYN